jgi:DNA-directed RNA polymerase subunit RPC12/RpoP
MRRVHRTVLERFSYLAIYSCKDCHAEDNLPRAHQLHRGTTARCPKCGTFRISRLKEPDRIDPMHSGVLNLLEKMAGGRLFHCRYCRIQFWDRRRLQSELAVGEAAPGSLSEAAPESLGEAETAAPSPDGQDA